MSIPKRYLPKNISKKDYKKQKINILKSRKLYKKGIYSSRPKISSFHSKPSKYVNIAEKMYHVDKIRPDNNLSKKTGCSQSSLRKIVNKGRGAYFSNGSRPNQSAESWGLARLASSITGNKASIVDYNILYKGCNPKSKALHLATRRCRKFGKCRKYTIKK